MLYLVSARLIVRFDGFREFSICPIQNNLGNAFTEHYGLRFGDLES